MNGKLMFIAMVALVCTGCATKYYNHNLSKSDADAQFSVDDGYCIQVSDGAVPMPEVRYYQPEQTRYTINATTTAYNSRTGYTTYNTTGSVNSLSTQSFATGFANGLNIGSVMAANDRRQRVYHGCMISLGWTTYPN